MPEDERISDENGSAILIQVDPPAEPVRRSSIRPFLPTLPSGVVVNGFQEGQQEVDYLWLQLRYFY